MATESVKILIEAEDKATAQLRKAVTEQEKAAAKAQFVRDVQIQSLKAERIALEQGAEAAEAYKLTLQGVDDQTAKLIARERALIQEQKQANAELAKQPGALKSTKATTEFFGAVAGMAGGSQVASLAGQLAGLTEKTGQFAEVAKAGGSSALMFKAGLVAAAGAIGVQAGQALGTLVFQSDAAAKSLDRIMQKSKELDAISLKNIRSAFADFKTDSLELNLGGNAGSEQAAEEEIARLHQQIKDAEKRKQVAEQTIKVMEGFETIDFGTAIQGHAGLAHELSGYLDSFTGDHKAYLAEQLQSVEHEKSKLDILREQKTELERMLTIEKDRKEKSQIIAGDSFIDGLKEQLESVKAEARGARNEYDALKNTANLPQAAEAQGLLDEIEAVKRKIEEEKKLQDQKDKAAQKEAERSVQLAELRKGEIDKIKEQAIALAEGKEAAHAFRLEQQGLSSFRAKEIAAEQAEIDRLNEAKNRKAEKPQSIQAVESRLLTRGPEQDQTAKNTAEIARLAKEQLEKLNKIAAKADKQVVGKKIELELVSK